MRDRAGNPIAGESITILSNTSGFGMPSEMGMVETDGQGHYFRGHLPAGTYVVMRNLFGMLGGGSGIGSKTAVVEEGMITEVNFDEKGARLWGFVKRARSTLRNYEEMEPVRGARLMLTGVDNHAVMASAQTDEAGRYEFVGLDAGKYHVTLQGTAMGFSVLRFSEVALGREEEKELNFTWPEGVIRGRVVTRSGGRPIAGAEVYFKLTGAPAAGMPAFPSMVRSDAEGRFEKGELAGGVVLVTARAEGHGQDEVEVRLAEGEVTEDVVLHLGGGGVLAGRIARADGAAEPFPGKMLKLFRPDGSPALPGLNIVPTEADGRYRIDGLPAGDVLVLALGMGLAPQMLPATIRDGETTTLDIAMQPGIVLELSVVDDEGHPVEHAHIAVRNAADFTLPLEESGLINKTGARYSVPLGREAYTLTLFCEGYQPVILSRDFRDAPTRVVESVVLPVAPP
ncbi:carboxypeptidase regulatory-like domain-containing protein [bacterium]|nr:carboxypeptidase regulatory-like domain-containing protein [bacterium]